MIDTIYIENEIKQHPRVEAIVKRFKTASIISCNRYGEIFNLKAQNFRLQKQKPALILARKHSGYVLPTPVKYGIGNLHNYYFSHMLNCIYDCRYCFLQGMYQSAHYVIFVNFEDFQSEIEKTILDLDGKPATFFSGYDGDSLALDNVTNFAEEFIAFFKKHPNYEIELRTKSININPLLKLAPVKNVVIAYSLNNEFVTTHIEHKTPSLERRLKALSKLQKAGWSIGLRLDPLIYHRGWQEHYSEMFKKIFQTLDLDQIHSVSLGAFRMPHSTYKEMANLYPDEPLFFSKLRSYNEGVSYHKEIEEAMRVFCEEKISSRIALKHYYPATF